VLESAAVPHADAVASIDEALAERDREFPSRGPAFARASALIDALAGEVLGEALAAPFEPDASLVSAARDAAPRPIFICGAMKSGTTLLAQLLDGHPRLVVAPGDSHYVHQRDRFERNDLDAIARHWLHRVINPVGQQPFWFLGPDRDVLVRFVQYLRHFLETTREDVLVCAVLAMHAANPRRAPRLERWVEKTPDNESQATWLAARHPQAHFVHVVRNPLANVAALLKQARVRGWDATALDYAVSLRRLMRLARANEARIGAARYHVVRYEDVAARPGETMRALCAALGLEFDASVLRPTSNGEPATSNSMYADRRVRGEILAPDRATQDPLHGLDAADARDVVSAVSDEAIRLGYDWDRPEIARYRLGFLGRLVRVHGRSLARRARRRAGPLARDRAGEL
jgi:hypothetical protein